ncbi:MAG: hypothetical protein V1715_14085 [bacterium]
MVIGAKNIHNQIITALYFCFMIGNIRQTVGCFIHHTFPQHPVIGSAVITGPEPDSAVFIICCAARFKAFQNIINQTVIVQTLFIIEGIKHNSQFLKRVPDIGKHGLFGRFSKNFMVRLVVKPITVFFLNIPGNIDDIITLVMLVRQLIVKTQQLAVTNIRRLPQNTHLPAGVIVIILTVNVITIPFQNPGNRVTQHGLSPVSNRQRSGWIRTDEFHLRFGPFT